MYYKCQYDTCESAQYTCNGIYANNVYIKVTKVHWRIIVSEHNCTIDIHIHRQLIMQTEFLTSSKYRGSLVAKNRRSILIGFSTICLARFNRCSDVPSPQRTLPVMGGPTAMMADLPSLLSDHPLQAESLPITRVDIPCMRDVARRIPQVLWRTFMS